MCQTISGFTQVSTLMEKPPIGSPITTSALPMSDVQKVIDLLRESIPRGSKAFWITPFVNSSNGQLGSACERFEHLNTIFPGQIGLIYGDMRSVDKDKVINDFTSNKIRILVATIVVEVGVDIPDASICIIERAHYFGLSQMHQIRGRIGRGARQASDAGWDTLDTCQCILLYDDISEEKSKNAKGEKSITTQRMEVMVKCSDGFEIAQRDLELRGAGDVFGIRQHGDVKLRCRMK